MVDVTIIGDRNFDARVVLYFNNADVIPVQYTETKRIRPSRADLYYSARNEHQFKFVKAELTGPTVKKDGSESDKMAGTNTYYPATSFAAPPAWLVELAEAYRPRR